MEHVGAVIGVELARRAIEREPRAGDAVGIASDGRAEELALGEIFVERVMAEHDVVAASGAVRHMQASAATAP